MFRARRRQKIIEAARRTFLETSAHITRGDARSQAVSTIVESLLDSLKGNRKERTRALYLIEGDGAWCLVPEYSAGHGPSGEVLTALLGLGITQEPFPGTVRKELR